MFNSLIEKIKSTKMFSKSSVALGTGEVTQYIVFENKYLFSIIFYKWNTIDQVRFHSHAFPSVAFLLKGWYHETVIIKGHKVPNFINVPLVPRLIPKGYVHSIGFSKPGTLTLVLTGKWDKTWFEYFDDSETLVEYSWGRKVVRKSKSNGLDW